eukprot:2380328-Amphidinium_carterae.1
MGRAATAPKNPVPHFRRLEHCQNGPKLPKCSAKRLYTSRYGRPGTSLPSELAWRAPWKPSSHKTASSTAEGPKLGRLPPRWTRRASSSRTQLSPKMLCAKSLSLLHKRTWMDLFRGCNFISAVP